MPQVHTDGALLLVSPSPLRREALRLLLLHHADIPVVVSLSLLEAHRRIESGLCRAVLADHTVPHPALISEVQRLAYRWSAIPIGVLLAPLAAAQALVLLRVGVRVLLNAEAPLEEFLVGIGLLLQGESFLSPPFAEVVRRGLTEQPPHARLSPREWQVLMLLLHGKTYREIGSLLGMNAKTASTYWSRIARKLGCSTRADLFRYAYVHGLLSGIPER